jgi:hypothetical protein
VLCLEYTSLTEPTVDDVRVLLEREVAIRIDLQEDLVALDAPEQIVGLHDTLVDWHAAAIEAEKALIARAGAASSLTEVEQSAEAAAYDRVMEEGLVACQALQTELDATAERCVFAENPWLPGEMKEIVNAVLGCGPDI